MSPTRRPRTSPATAAGSSKAHEGHRTARHVRPRHRLHRPGRSKGEIFAVITSVLDHQDLPAPDLAVAYHQRREIELAFDEFETHQRGHAAVLRPRSPDTVMQEFYCP
jgi:hypothetical protein